MEVRGTETEAAAPAVDKGLLADVFPTSIARHNTFGWQYDLALTADENYMDLAALVARNSLCNGGHMGCVLVKVSVRARTRERACAASHLAHA